MAEEQVVIHPKLNICLTTENELDPNIIWEISIAYIVYINCGMCFLMRCNLFNISHVNAIWHVTRKYPRFLNLVSAAEKA